MTLTFTANAIALALIILYWPAVYIGRLRLIDETFRREALLVLALGVIGSLGMMRRIGRHDLADTYGGYGWVIAASVVAYVVFVSIKRRNRENP